MQKPKIDVQLIARAKTIAIRTGKWFKLHPAERILIDLTIKTLKHIRSQTLIQLILKILDKISPKITYIYKAYQIGLEIAKKRVEQALKLGYIKAKKWLKDINYIIYLGVSYLNTSPIYQIN